MHLCFPPTNLYSWLTKDMFLEEWNVFFGKIVTLKFQTVNTHMAALTILVSQVVQTEVSNTGTGKGL